MTTLDQVRPTLQHSPTAQDAINFLDSHGLPVEFSGRGAQWDGTKVLLGADNDPYDAAVGITHEAWHARMDKEGKKADVNRDSRADFVRKQIEEDAQAQALALEAKRQIVEAGYPFNYVSPAETQYNTAYQNAVNAHKTANAQAAPAELNAAGQRAGHAAVLNEYSQGRITAGGQGGGAGKTYQDYWGDDWDARHRP